MGDWELVEVNESFMFCDSCGRKLGIGEKVIKGIAYNEETGGDVIICGDCIKEMYNEIYGGDV